MSAEMTALGERAVRCKGWRWSSAIGCEILWVEEGRAALCDIVVGAYDDPIPPTCETPLIQTMHHLYRLKDPTGCAIPDLTASATLGCLLAMVRKAWRDDGACAAREGPTNKWHCDVQRFEFFADSEAEALIAALEAAP